MKKTYLKPSTEIVELYVEKHILAASGESLPASDNEESKIDPQGKINSFDVFDMDEE